MIDFFDSWTDIDKITVVLIAVFEPSHFPIQSAFRTVHKGHLTDK